MIILWWIIFIVLLVVFVVLHAIVFPKAFLTVDFGNVPVPDRGFKKVIESNGQSLVYEPALKIRKYIMQYILSERGGKKCVICKTADTVQYLDYDVAIFNNEGKVFKVLNVKELVEGKGVTKPVNLPENTAFVTIMINTVNNLKSKSSLTKRVFAKKIVLYLLVCMLIEILAVVGIKVCMANIFGGIYGESFLFTLSSWKMTALIAAVVVVLNALATLIVLKCKSVSKAPEEDGEDE